MVGKQMSLVRPANAKSQKMTSGEAHTATAQTNNPSSILSWPFALLLLACNDGDSDLGIKAYPSVALHDSPCGQELND